jgi:translocation and assembly module TamB
MKHESMTSEMTETIRRRRWKYLPHVVWTGSGIAALVVLAVIGLLIWANSSSFENLVRKRLISRLETATGGRVELQSFHWRLLDLEADAGGLVIHGREESGDAPYTQLESLRVKASILDIFSPRILLREVEVVRPKLHLIVYPDGSTNQPQPKKQSKSSQHPIDSLFDLQAGQVTVEQGMFHYENRASDSDFQNRYIPLDCAANDVSIRLAYIAPDIKNPETYHLELGAHDLSLSRGTAAKPVAPAVHGYAQATLDLTRNAAYLRSLRIAGYTKGATPHVLNVSGELTDFSHPQWKAVVNGDLDLRLMEPLTGYPSTPDGIASINIAGQGHSGEFRADGTVHTQGAAYVGTGVNAHGIGLDAHVHADPERLQITSVIARLQQGGQLEGEVLLDHWIAPLPGAPELRPVPPPTRPGKNAKSKPRTKTPEPLPPPAPAHPAPVDLHTNGKVNAYFRNVTVDTVLDLVGQNPFKRLGMDARLNGLSTAIWTNGDVRTLSVSANFNLTPSGKYFGVKPATAGNSSASQEVPSSGIIDATYTQRDGGVDLRRFELTLPASQIEARGHLGAYPLNSPTGLTVDFHSRDLTEFDRILRDLGLIRHGTAGSNALPVALGGVADFHGTWSGSLIDPHIAGNVSATDLSIEFPPRPNDQQQQPQFVRWDSLQASGSYSATRISIDHGQLNRGGSSISLNGTLTADPDSIRRPGVPAFDSDATLNAHVHASAVKLDEFLPMIGQELPVTGTLNAQIETDGQIHALNGSGWIEVNDGSVYNQPISRIRAQGRISEQTVQLSSVDLTDAAGTVSGSGSYDLKSRRFQGTAHASALDIAKLRRLRDSGIQIAGTLNFTASASGSVDDPHLTINATVTGLRLSGEPLGALEFSGHTVNRNFIYDLTSKFEAAQLAAHGQTALTADYATQATIDFSHFNVGTLLKLSHIESFTGESSLAGSVTIDGPLARPEQIRGETRLQEMALTLAGVHLRSDGPLHATLADSRITLDPLHITGEQTDLQLGGNVSLKDKKPIDFAAKGSVNLKLAETIDPDVTANGTTTFEVEAHGTMENPGLRGRINFDKASLALQDLPNSLSQLSGTLEFNQDRLEVKSLTAISGGGILSVSGYLAYRHGLYAALSLTGKGIRIRYPEGVSSAADINLRLDGSQNSLLLSGGIMITRFTVSPNVDFVALAAHSNKAKPVTSPDAPSNHVRLDVHIQSSPQLNFQNAYAKLAGDVDLRLRGTIASPSLLGRISVTEGSATIAGTRYELQRGEITFNNPVRIQPTIDLNATSRVEDYDITLGLHGTIDQMNVTYRSDPPLPEADVVALLALGRTQDQQRLYMAQQEQVTANPTTDALLGGALNATVSSRVQKLFGAGSVKVDPNYLGVLGNSTTRITVEEQLGKYLTLTYATDVDTTAQQFLQAEIAINRHVSLLVTRDESGVFSMVVKATRRFR